MTVLSKTNYLIYRDCKKNAWLKLNKPDIYNKSELSEFEKSIIETGNVVELEARKLYPGGILVEGRDEEAQKMTAELIAKNEPVIFQPVFVKDNFLAAVDILVYDAESAGWDICEVKASNEVKEKVHLYDLAFQYILLKNCGLKINKAKLIHLDPEYVRKGGLILSALFAADDLTEQIKDMAEETEEEMQKALEYVSFEDEPKGNCDCLYKGRSKHCTTFTHSNPEIPEYGIHDIARIGLSKAKLRELVDSEIFHLHDVPEDLDLSEIQRNQIEAHVRDKATVYGAKIAEELDALEYPLYFLDYETFPAAIPRFDGFSPYQQIPFQFSLHVLESQGSTLKHFEFLHIEQTDPSRPLADHLQKHIGPKGSVIVWNKKFEMKINEQLAERLPEFKKFINDLNSRVYDLMDIFTKQHYVHKGFKGSTSIKKVLPVLAPDLSYKTLEIQEGGAATQAWDKIVSSDMSQVEKSEIARDLKEYCKLDTYAMYAIWENLRNRLV